MATVPVAGLIAFLLLGIEEIGVQIEEPFSYIHLEDICGIIKSDLRAAHAADAGLQVPPPSSSILSANVDTFWHLAQMLVWLFLVPSDRVHLHEPQNQG